MRSGFDRGLDCQALGEESARCNELQMMNDSKDADIENLRRLLQSATNDSISTCSEADDNTNGECSSSSIRMLTNHRR